MKTGIFSLPDRKMTFREAVDYAKMLGLDAIEPYPNGELTQPDTDAARRIADYAAEQGIGVCCFSMGADLVSGDVKAEIERLKRYADVAAALGSPYLHHTLYPQLNFGIGSIPFKQALSRAVAGVREVYDYAEQQGVKCLYEDQGFYFNGVERFDDFLGEVNRDVGVVLDMGNILFVGEKPEAFAARFAPLIRHVHAKDYLSKDGALPSPGPGWYVTRGGGYLRGTVIGHGVVNFQRVFGILQSAGYDGYFSMEYDGMEESRGAQKLGLANMRRYEALARLDSMEHVEVHL